MKAIHSGFSTMYPEYKMLEISSKSLQELGTKLCAFSLTKYIPERNTTMLGECIYQSSKVFSNGGFYTDLIFKSAKDAKTDI